MFERKHIPSMIAALATVGLLSACNQHRNGPGSSPANAQEAVEQAAGQMSPTSNAVGYEKVEDAQASVESVTSKTGDHEDMLGATNLENESPELAAAVEDLKKVTDATIRKGNSADAEKVPMELVLKEHDQNIATVRFVQGDQNSEPEIVEKRADFPLESVQLNATQDPSQQEESYESAVLTFRQKLQPQEQGQFMAEQQQAEPEDKVVRVIVRLTPVQQEQQEEVQQPQAESKQAPQAESKQAPQAESKQAPQAESKQAPQAESKQAPQAESKQTPQAEGKQTPQAESREQNTFGSQQPQAESRSQRERPEEKRTLGQRISDRVGRIFHRR